MTRLKLPIASCFIVWTGLTAHCMGASWSNAEVLPKSGDADFLKQPAGDKSAGSLDQIAWPATVAKVDGQWLRIADAGGYSAEPLKGWVRKDDFVKLDDAQQEFTQKIRDPNTKKGDIAEAHWLRGIYWEAKEEYEAAIADYRAACKKGRQTGDLYLRLGRSLAKLAKREAPINRAYALKVFRRSLDRFADAEHVFQCDANKPYPAELYVSWGDAFYERYRTCKECDDCADAISAMKGYRCAETLSPAWYVPPYRQGRLLLEVFEKFHDAGNTDNKPDKKTLLAAVQRLTQAIRLDPGQKEPYRERADALYLLTKAKDENCHKIECKKINCELCELIGHCGLRPELLDCPDLQGDNEARRALLDQAFRSADRAHILGNNRDPDTLEIRGIIQEEMANTFYDKEEAPICPEGLEIRLNIHRSQLLLASAGRVLNEAADRSLATADIERRLTRAGKNLNRAIGYRNYLNRKVLPDCPSGFSTVSAQMALVTGALREGIGDQNEIGDLSLRQLAAEIAATPGSEKSKSYKTAIKMGTFAARNAYEAIRVAQERTTLENLDHAILAIRILNQQVGGLRDIDAEALAALERASPGEFDKLPDVLTAPSVDVQPLQTLRNEILALPPEVMPMYAPRYLSN